MLLYRRKKNKKEKEKNRQSYDANYVIKKKIAKINKKKYPKKEVAKWTENKQKTHRRDKHTENIHTHDMSRCFHSFIRE